ncbi:MAG TPA: TonB-dependent receptor [Burkholderiaceae bacterium]|nr:TonB-dependent receptor [Burkholderiaceae bacterium]
MQCPLLHRGSSLPLFCASWIVTGVVFAQDASELPRTVVTPSRTAQPINEALPATSIITREDIDRWQSVDLVSILGRETGVQFAVPGGRGAAASLFLRGASSSQVLVLVDGVRLNAGASGGAALGGIALDAIDRIEIVRGNLSSVYGSSAVGGVVQIFTRNGAAPGLTLSAEAGQGRTLDGTVSGGVDAGPVRLGGALGSGTTRAFSAIDTDRVVKGPFAPGANADLDGNQYLSASLGATYRTGETLISANAWFNRNLTDFDSTADGPTATHEEESRLGALSVLARAAITERWASQLAFGASRDRSTNSVSDPASFSNGEFTSDNAAVTWSNDFRLDSSIVAQLGAEYLRQSGESTSYVTTSRGGTQRYQRAVGSGWVGATGNHGPHQLQANVRYDQYSDTGNATSGLLAYGYRLDQAWRLTAQVSNAFRAPSFNDLYFPFFGNPDLDPERSVSGELGLRYVGSAGSMRAALFRTDTRDLIAYDPLTMRAGNIDQARVTGLELGGDWRGGPWHIGANATLLRAVNDDTGERLLRRAPWLVNLALDYDPGPWSAGMEVAVVGPRDDLDINTFARVQLASYTLVRLVGAWRVSGNLTLRARIENLLDTDYESVSGYNTAPRTAIVGLNLRY